MVTEQEIYARTCTCDHTTCGDYSRNANAQVGYGENIEVLVAYLHAHRHRGHFPPAPEVLSDPSA